MIGKLRRQFVILAMCVVVGVLATLMLGVNLVNAYRVDRQAETLLDMLSENAGAMPPPGERPRDHAFSAETPFETRYFSVLRNAAGEAVQINTGHVAAISDSAAAEAAEAVADSGRRSGYFHIYKYRAVETEEGVLYLFLDRRRELSTLRSFRLTSLYISLAGVLMVFALIVLLSRRVMRPIADNYEKQKRFITDASHELKTPLTIIDANTEVLELENGKNEWTTSIQNQVRRLAALTDSLTALCRIEEMGVSPLAVDFSLSDAVRETLKSFETPARLRGKRLEISVADGISLHGDERAVRQLVSLLADNAVKYASDNSVIRFSLRQQGRRRILECQNAVDAIERGNHDCLFERFYRADASRSSTVSGSGIGLSVARAIVSSLGGRITAQSDDGQSLRITAVF